jgi:ribonuclease J
MIRISFLGGLGEVGRNCMVIENEQAALVIDAGVMFPDSELLGVDLVLPELSYLERIRQRVAAIVLTHGHEDHIGALPFVIPRIGPTVLYGSALTLKMAARKLQDHGLSSLVELRSLEDRQKVTIDGIGFTLFATAHSVPDSCGVLFETPDGVVLHTGDFKLDPTPLDGRTTDLRFIAAAAERGIDLMLCDSTNAAERGWISSERQVGKFLEDLFGSRRNKRIIATCFASHLHRIQQLVDTGVAHRRKICFVGRSLERNIEIACEAGKLSLPAESIIDPSRLANFSPQEVLVICTGSQGEPYSSLSLMAAGQHPWLSVSDSDTIVVSSHPIPGNEPAIYRVIDGLYEKGCEVLYSEVTPEVHVSGHAAAEDIKTVLSLATPKAFVPVHGELRHMAANAELAREVLGPSAKVLIAGNGDVVVLNRGNVELQRAEVPAGFWYVDSGSVGTWPEAEGTSAEIVRERSVLAREGLVVVAATVSSQTGEVVGDIEVIGRGWSEDRLTDKHLAELKKAVVAAIQDATLRGAKDWGTLKRQVRSAVSRFLQRSGAGRPMVIPVVIEV